MKPFVTVPRQALAELLQAAGSPLTPEQFEAAQTQMNDFRKYPSRAWAAAFSKYFLIVVAVAAVVLLPVLGFTLENLVIAAGLITVTFFEYRVHAYFRTNNVRAPDLGYRNQALFALAILLYCLYHAFVPVQLSAQDQMMLVEQNNLIDAGMLKRIVRFFYLFVAVLAGGSQFGLACYYRRAKTRPEA